MTTSFSRPSVHRSEVGPIELFFDLVYVFAIIQLSHLLIGHLSWSGAAQTAVVFAAVWWGWNYTAWAMNWLNPAKTAVQLFMGVLMLAALGMSTAIPSAFGHGAWLFVGCYLFMGIARPLLMMFAFHGQQLAANYRMLLVWTLLAGVFWVLGAAAPDQWRLVLWLLAVLIDYAAPLSHFRIPGLGAAPMHLWDTDAEHLAERNRLVFIIALGESILLMGGSLVEHGELTVSLGLGLVVGFASIFVLWWNYFAVPGSQGAGGEASTKTLRTAYAYAHALMVLGAILVAVSIELRMSHEHLTPAIVLVTIAGPLVYLLGNLLFARSRFGQLGTSRLVATAALLVIGALALVSWQHLPTLLLSLVVLAVTTVLAAYTAIQAKTSAD